MTFYQHSPLILSGISEVLLLGGGDVMLAAAQEALKLGFKVRVVSSGRLIDEQLITNPHTLREVLERTGIEYRVSSTVKFADSAAKDVLALSFGAPWIFSSELIASFEGRLLNVHGARLPVDRGAGGFSWQIMQGNRQGASLIHIVDDGIDSGPIVGAAEFEYSRACRFPIDYIREHIERDKTFIGDLLRRVKSGCVLTPSVQSEQLSTYWPRLSTSHHGWIDWSWPARDIERFVLAFSTPYAGASTMLDAQRVHIMDAYTVPSEASFHPFQAGLVYRILPGRIFVAARESGIVVTSVRTSSGHEIRGDVRVGARLVTPHDRLDEAKAFRSVYSPDGLVAQSNVEQADGDGKTLTDIA